MNNDAIIEHIFYAVTTVYGVSREEILSRNRHQNITDARHMGMLLVSDRLGLTPREAGRWFNRDRVTVSYGATRMRELLSFDRVTQGRYKRINDILFDDLAFASR